MRKKKGITFINGLIEILLILIVFIVLLRVTGLYNKIINSFGEDTLCEGSFIASAMTRTFGQSTIDPQCKTKKITFVDTIQEEGETEGGGIKMALARDYVSTFPNEAFDTYARVNAWNDAHEGSELDYKYKQEKSEEQNQETRQMDDDEYVTKRYNMDKLVADEMLRCWNIVGQGKLPLFDTSWSFIGCRDSTGIVRECRDWGDLWQNLGNVQDLAARPSANFCVLCSRIKFDEKIEEQFQGVDDETYDSINRWMANNPWQAARQTSYYEYLLDESQRETFYNLPSYEYSSQEPYAVVFLRVNFHALPSGALRISDGINDFIIGGLTRYDGTDRDPVYYANVLRLIPYQELPNQCNYIVGSYI